jgi:hypothetical protein
VAAIGSGRHPALPRCWPRSFATRGGGNLLRKRRSRDARNGDERQEKKPSRFEYSAGYVLPAEGAAFSASDLIFPRGKKLQLPSLLKNSPRRSHQARRVAGNLRRLLRGADGLELASATGTERLADKPSILITRELSTRLEMYRGMRVAYRSCKVGRIGNWPVSSTLAKSPFW